MKFKILLLIFAFPAIVIGQDDPSCETDSSKSLMNFISSKCSGGVAPNVIDQQIRSSQAKPEFCEKCRPSEQSGESTIALSESKLDSENKKEFARTVLNELRKNMASQVTDLLRMRSTKFSFNSDQPLKDAVLKCNIQNLGNQKCTSGKSKNQTIDSILSKTFHGTDKKESDSLALIQSQIGMEIYNTFNTPVKDGGLYERNDHCMTDNQLNQAKMSYWDSLINKENMLKIKDFLATNKIDFKKDVADQLSNSLGRKSQGVVSEIFMHPFFKETFKSQESVDKYFSSISTSDTNESIQDKLYSKDNSSRITNRINSNCEVVFKSIKETFCSDKFVDGNVSLADHSGYSLLNEDLLYTKPKYEKKLSVYCHGFNKNNAPLTMGPINKSICSNLDEESKNSSFDIMAKTTYKNEFASLKGIACEKIDEIPCTGKAVVCKIVEFYKNSQLPNSPESKLLSQHNDSVDQILRSFVGSAPDIKDSKVRSFLVDQGILPKSDGSFTPPKASDRTMSPSEIASARDEYAKQNSKYSYQKPSGTTGQSSEDMAQNSQAAGDLAGRIQNFMPTSPDASAAAAKKAAPEDKFGDQLSERLARQIAAKQAVPSVADSSAASELSDSPEMPLAELPQVESGSAPGSLVGAVAAAATRPAAANNSFFGKSENRVTNKISKDAPSGLDPSYNAALNGANMLENPPAPVAASGATSSAQGSSSSDESESKLKRTPASLKTPQETNLVLVLSKVHQLSPDFFKNKVLIEPMGENFVITVDGAKMSLIYDKKKNIYREVHDDKFNQEYLATIVKFFNAQAKQHKQ